VNRPGEYLDVADDLDALADGFTEERLSERNARTRNDRIHAFQEHRVESAQRGREARELAADDIQ
jgi:hypothetical protein